MNARTLAEIEPVDEAIRSLRTWPDSALFRLATAVGDELIRRRLPTPVALPVVDVLYGWMTVADAMGDA